MNEQAKKQLWDMENRFWQSMMDGGDSEVAVAMLDGQAISASGWGVNKFDPDGYRKMAEGSPFDMKDFRLSDDQWVFPADDVAVVAYTAELTYNDRKGGDDQRMKAYDTSTWIRKNGQWKCALHTESPVSPDAPV